MSESSTSTTSAEVEICFLALVSESSSESCSLDEGEVAGGALATPERCFESAEESSYYPCGLGASVADSSTTISFGTVDVGACVADSSNAASLPLQVWELAWP